MLDNPKGDFLSVLGVGCRRPPNLTDPDKATHPTGPVASNPSSSPSRAQKAVDPAEVVEQMPGGPNRQFNIVVHPTHRASPPTDTSLDLTTTGTCRSFALIVTAKAELLRFVVASVADDSDP